jgi:ABC-type uncharacterized transport system substrate-binding protein
MLQTAFVGMFRETLLNPQWHLLRLIVVAAAILLQASRPVHADIHIVMSSNAAHYNVVADDIGHYLENYQRSVKFTRSTIGSSLSRPSNNQDLVITIGTAASQFVNNHFPSNPSLNLFITHNTWQALDSSQSRRAAIVLDQPVNRYLLLAGEIAPDAKNIGVVFGKVSKEHRSTLLRLTKAYGLTLKHRDINRNSNPLETLSALFDITDVFIALPDEALFNRNVAQWALHLAYKKQIPLIGFSRSYTEAGAVASLFTDPKDISRQALEWLNLYLSGDDANLWQPADPHYFTIAVNQMVSRVLGMHLSEAELVSRVTVLERGDLDLE